MAAVLDGWSSWTPKLHHSNSKARMGPSGNWSSMGSRPAIKNVPTWIYGTTVSQIIDRKNKNGTMWLLAPYPRMHQGDRRQTVLVVEDEVFIRMAAVASLEDAGLHVLEAADSSEAVA